MHDEGGSPTRVGVLALQGDFREHMEALRRLNVEPVEVRLPRDLEGIEGLIIPGGESTTMARLLDRDRLLEPLRRRIEDGLPVMGTCAGSIILARSAPELDRPGLEQMSISVRRNAFGRQRDSFEADLPIPHLGKEPFHAVFIRAPLIEAVYPPAEALAKLEDGTVVAAREGSLLAFAFHPELTGDPRIHAYFLDIIRERCAVDDEVAVAHAPR